MPSGACVIRREGKRGTTWYVKFRDAAGVQVKQRLGGEGEGWNRQRAERELGKRLDLVERERWRKPEKLLFAMFAERFRQEYLPGRNLRPSTLLDYEGTLKRHLIPAFGELELAALEPKDVDRYVSRKTAAGLSAKTIGNHLRLLSVMFKVAIRWRVVRTNPVVDVDLPRHEQSEMNVLSEVEVARFLAAFSELERECRRVSIYSEEQEWWRLSRRLVVVALGTGLRRGELLGLAWKDVRLLDGVLSVRQAFVRGEMQPPKSRASRRTIELGPRVLAALQEQWQESRYRGDEDVVFGHPYLGTPLDPSKVSRHYLRPALKRAKIEKPFRCWHDLRHTALTHEAAAGNPQAYVQLKAGHAQGSITERYIHAAQVLFPGAAAKAEKRLFREVPA